MMARDGAKTKERILDGAERLVLEQGLAATSIDEVLEASGTSKGAFFHHFPSKSHLARALVERYAAGDVAYLETTMARVEEETDDPAEQVVSFIRHFEAASEELVAAQPSCLYVSYLFERQLFDDGTNDVIVDAVTVWQQRILEKLRAAAANHPPLDDVDLVAVADHIFATFEGAFVLARATSEPAKMRDQLHLVRRYVALLFGVDPGD